MSTYLNPKNGESIETFLSPDEARKMIRTNAPTTDNFAHDLTSRVRLSNSQLFWLIKKAMQYNPALTAVTVAKKSIQVGAGFAKLAQMFQTAKVHLKFPKIRLQDSQGNSIQLSLASDTSKNPGFIYIKANKIYAGKISPTGEFYPIQSCPLLVKEYLKNFSENPEMVAAEYGRMTGNCCFCSRTLRDERSTSVGYGPICAGKFGLAWG